MKKFITFFLILIIATTLSMLHSVQAEQSGLPPQDFLDKIPDWAKWQFTPKHKAPYVVEKSNKHFSETDWAAVIDSTWGPGWSYNEHKTNWLTFWSNIDNYFACFHDLDPNLWQDIYDNYYPEVEDTVSRGRLYSMMSHSCLALHESHTWTTDNDVFNTALDPGVPLLVVGAWGYNSHFGAGLTVLEDTSLLVYKVIESHPLGLEVGDIVLGYEGVLWKDTYPELLLAELPLTGWWWGSNDYSFDYSFQVSGGMNWHLFNTIDILKYSTGDTVHLSTSLLENQIMSLWATEQLDVDGVSIPDYYGGEQMTWGVVDGTNIGYIYTMGFHAYPDSALFINSWLTALDSLQNYYDVSGLIIDFRTNYGASMSFAEVLNYMFDTTMLVSSGDRRCGAHLDLCRYPDFDYFFDINGENGNYWDRPLAILTGPGAISGGDLYSLILAMHPEAKVFGRPTAGAYNLVVSWFINSNYSQRVSYSSHYIMSDSGNYLTHKTFPSIEDFPWVNYENVWLTQEGVVQGRDDVVEAAIDWINVDCCNLRGDVNNDETIGISDITYFVDYLFNSGPVPSCYAEGDVNYDGTHGISDLTFIVDYLFGGGPTPADC